VQPVVEEMCEELSATVLRPTLEQGGMPSGDVKRRRIWYNAVKITNHPDRGKDATDVFDRGELSGEALRLAKGFESGDVPSDAERARWIGVRVRDAGLAWYGEPTLKESAAPEQGTPITQTDPDTETPPQEGGTGADAPVGAPEEAARLLGAAETALLTCRRTAGSRIVQKLPRSEARRLGSIPRHKLYALLGREVLSAANGHFDPYELVRSGTEPLEHTLEAWGYPPERIQAIAEAVRRHAADTLHLAEPSALPPVILNL
jgi:hypothetical protein